MELADSILISMSPQVPSQVVKGSCKGVDFGQTLVEDYRRGLERKRKRRAGFMVNSSLNKGDHSIKVHSTCLELDLISGHTGYYSYPVRSR